MQRRETSLPTATYPLGYHRYRDRLNELTMTSLGVEESRDILIDEGLYNPKD